MKIEKTVLARWSKYCRLLLAEHGYTPDQVTTGSDAWNIAHKLDIPREAYAIDDSIVDAHIKTALQHIFPNAVFKDRYHY
jgi:hypothetical protein